MAGVQVASLAKSSWGECAMGAVAAAAGSDLISGKRAGQLAQPATLASVEASGAEHGGHWRGGEGE